MKRTKIIYFTLLVGLTALFGSGCVGPKMITSQPSSSRNLQPIPANAKLFVVSKCDDGVAYSVVQNKLAKALRGTGKFATIECGATTSNGLQLNIEIRVERSRWGRRAYNGDFSRVILNGELVSGQTTLVTLHESRSGSGGVFGAGGFLACGEDRMVKSLTCWVIQDAADYLESVKTDEKQAGLKPPSPSN
jgi:hypothetical protein